MKYVVWTKRVGFKLIVDCAVPGADPYTPAVMDAFSSVATLEAVSDALVPSLEGIEPSLHAETAAQLAGNALAVAADIDIPGGEPDDDDVLSG